MSQLGADHRSARPTRRAVLGGVAAGSLVLLGRRQAPAAASWMPQAPPPPIHFDVIRGSDLIGTHDVTFEAAAGGGLAVRTHIDIAVRILAVTVFDFRHDSTELWRDQRLQAFDSKTHDDDSEFFVTGRAMADGFQVTNKKGTGMVPADIMVSSYWTSEIARQKVVLDAQRGRLKDQTLLGTDTVAIAVVGRPVEATRYRLAGVTNGWVAYDDRGRWLAAELQKKGTDILYRLRT